jgi:hypothetical protein
MFLVCCAHVALLGRKDPALPKFLDIKAQRAALDDSGDIAYQV